jgi:hypothetical protein
MRPTARMTGWTRDGRLCQPACAGGPRRRARRPSSRRAIAAVSSAEEPDPDILKAALDVSGADVVPELATLPERPATRSSQPRPREVKEKTK